MSTLPFTSTAPTRLHASLFAVVLILMPAPVWFAELWWRWLLTMPCLALAGVLLLSIPCPRFFLNGLRVDPGGFELRRPLRRPSYIDYTAITQVEAIVQRDGDMGFPFVDLIIRTATQSVRVPESFFRETPLVETLRSLNGFDAEAYDIAQHYEPFGLTEVFPKRFTVLSR